MYRVRVSSPVEADRRTHRREPDGTLPLPLKRPAAVTKQPSSDRTTEEAARANEQEDYAQANTDLVWASRDARRQGRKQRDDGATEETVDSSDDDDGDSGVLVALDAEHADNNSGTGSHAGDDCVEDTDFVGDVVRKQTAGDGHGVVDRKQVERKIFVDAVQFRVELEIEYREIEGKE